VYPVTVSWKGFDQGSSPRHLRWFVEEAAFVAIAGTRGGAFGPCLGCPTSC